MYNIIHVYTYCREIFRVFSFFNVFWWTLQQVIILKENFWVPGNKQDTAQFTLFCIFPCPEYFPVLNISLSCIFPVHFQCLEISFSSTDMCIYCIYTCMQLYYTTVLELNIWSWSAIYYLYDFPHWKCMLFNHILKWCQ